MHPETIKPRQWIVVTKEIDPPPPEDNDYHSPVAMMLPVMRQVEEFHPTGVPIKVCAVSYPFLVGRPALAPDEITTVDLSRYVVHPVNKQYVEVFKNQYNLKLAQYQQQALRGPVLG